MKAAPLPVELSYLAPTLEALAKIPEEDLNEDVDVAIVEKALRDRVEGLNLQDAVSRLKEDRNALEKWLKNTGRKDGPAIFVYAFFGRPGPLARSLLAPLPPPEPTAEMETPTGWSSKQLPRQLVVRKGKISCVVTLSDKSWHERKLLANEARERAQNNVSPLAGSPGRWLKSAVQFGRCIGFKFLYVQNTPAKWKAVEYVLQVPGGFVSAQISDERGRDFDESEIEAKFDTLEVKCPQPL